ncbi:Glu/Leu/Phe/Val dehydrogenase dimerization domain-containing protein [Paenibacillus sp. LHD-117]|uniref:Leu/Phe/Val dehydrogenase n=1 Tax=Paenibacillus sp. LHD-117 TaxID=3071412 RepID=UPI0027E071E5|nr:Glu/Leu/Phe/Val dehydrogenase dimerization domain-containing protein [Paenibacillus sp. LHD-117]MDQ6423099.1 Glu/Leu/Phe/Val dehydrogenase dimerization domain-containing protein [Paenibacillus sp. LHD-117]
MWQQNYEGVFFLQDRASGFKAIIAIDNTRLGPALGGCRMWQYDSDEAAVTDALRLAKGMTYKSAISGLTYGGGKAVILSHPGQGAREQLFRTLGRYIDKLQGHYITGMDLGTTVADMDRIRETTSYVTDVSGSLGAVNDLTATMTAYGVFLGIRASMKRVFGMESTLGRTIAVQGLGKVGYRLCRYLREDGAYLVVTDIDPERVKQAATDFGATPCKPEAILSVPCDVFAPCALGGILNDAALKRLDCRIVAGAANNQLAEARHGEKLRELGILYAPDYVINAGGIIVTGSELGGGDAAEAKRNVEKIYGTLTNVYETAAATGTSTSAAADRMTEDILRK